MKINLLSFSFCFLFSFCGWASGAKTDCPKDTKILFNIPQQSIQDSLMQLAAQCELALIVGLSDVEGKTGNKLEGEYTIENALNALLINSGLSASLSKQGFIKISPELPALTEEKMLPKEFLMANSAQDSVVVTGFRYAFYSAAEFKQHADVIEDVITEYDIVQKPDRNVSESLQRLPGVAIERRLGEGTKINIRGFDKNLVLLNGESFLTGLEYYQMGWDDQSYENSLESVPMEMLQRIEVYKSYKASDIEGGVGGTVNLISRNPFEIKDTFLTGELGGDRGIYSQDAQPYSIISFGRNWDDRFASQLTLSQSTRVVHVDAAENFLGSAFLTSLPSSSMEDMTSLMTPDVSGIFDVEQKKVSRAIDLSVGFRLSPTTEISLNLVGLNNKINRQEYQIETELSIIDEGKNYRLNNHNHLATVDHAFFDQFGQTFIAYAENAESDALNVHLKLNFNVNDQLIIKNALSHSSARYNQVLGSSDAYYTGQNSLAPVWIGSLSKPVMSSSGWVTYGSVCPTCTEPGPESIGYDRSSFSFYDYRGNFAFNDISDGIITSSRANGNDSIQYAWTFRSDGDLVLGDDESHRVRFGIRYSEHELDYQGYKFLTNLAETIGTAGPNQFDENGGKIADSDFSRTRPSDDYNVVIRDAYYNDLCGNGGIAKGKICDIDGDGKDDKADSTAKCITQPA